MKHIPLFLLLMLLLSSCSKKVEVKKGVIPERPAPAGIIPEALIQKAEKKYGVFARNRYEAFNTMMTGLREEPVGVQLETVNTFFNNVPYGDDIDIWGQSDYWATPLEFLGRDRGDCEDYVIAKYFALRDLGIPSEKLYFSYVKSLRFNVEHMVLSYFPSPATIPLILDNTNFKIFPADQRKDLVPVYNFNMETLYRANHAGQNGQALKNNKKTQNRWERLLRDIENNKL